MRWLKVIFFDDDLLWIKKLVIIFKRFVRRFLNGYFRFFFWFLNVIFFILENCICLRVLVFNF